MTMREQPCPYRIVDDVGGGFAMGCAAGCLIYLFRGMWLSPKSERLYGGIMLIKKRAPILGGKFFLTSGSFGLWAGLFSITNCALISIRNKQDMMNQIIAGGVTGGLLAFRAGRRIAFKNAVFGSLFLAAIGVVEMGMIKYQRKQQLEMQNEMHERQIKLRRKQFAKMRPDLFSSTGQVLINARPVIAL